jgi:hypothetical protein
VQKAALELDVAPDEFEALEPRLRHGRPLLQIADSLINGSGLCRRLCQADADGRPDIARLIEEILAARNEWPLVDFMRADHEAQCATSCYMCIQQYQNRRYHPLLDWRLGLAYLRSMTNPAFQCGLDGDFDSYPELTGWPGKAQALAEAVASMRPKFWRVERAGAMRLPCLVEFDGQQRVVRRLVVIHPLWRADQTLLSRLGVTAASGDAVALSIVVVVGVGFAAAVMKMTVTRWQCIFLAFNAAVMTALCICIPLIIASSPRWLGAGPSLFLVSLLTLINAPFDWASLGLTRALLRRGLELGGWWPYFLAPMDAALSAVIITGLTVAMVIGTEAFNTAAVHGGGVAILPLKPLLDGLAKHPSEPKYWWIYALLISSMIPSMLNLAIGGVAFLRGVPGLRSVLLGFLPAGGAVPSFERA